MNDGRGADAARGMELAASLPDTMPNQTSEHLAPIYKDIQDSLRVPIVKKIFRSLANYPDYLEAAWDDLRPLIRSYNFEQRADELRKQALLGDVPLRPTLSLAGVDKADTLAAFNDTIRYVLPKLLLTVTAMHHASFCSAGHARKANVIDEEFYVGAANGSANVELVAPDDADERTMALFEAIKRRHGHPMVSSYFRGLANWPVS